MASSGARSWGTYADLSSLPNVSGSNTTQLLQGDFANVSGVGLHQCDDPTPGAAIWSEISGGGSGGVSAILGSGYSYTQPGTPVEEVLGTESLDGSLITGTPYFKVCLTNIFTTTGTTRVRLYDMGTPSVPGSPRLVSEITFSLNGGPRSIEQELTVVSSTPSTNEILDVERVYEAVVIQDVSTVGDSTFVGSAVLRIE